MKAKKGVSEAGSRKPEDIVEQRKKLLSGKKKSKPLFKRENWWRYGRMLQSWRKPRGRTSKLRRNMGYRQKEPTIGYKNPEEIRGLHPSGYEEVYIRTLKELGKVNSEEQALRLSGTLGKRKKDEILKKADELGIKVLNP